MTAGLCAVAMLGLVAVAVFVDLDTGDRVASIVGAAAGLAGLALALRQGTAPTPPPPAAPSVSGGRSVRAGGSIGRAVTGDGHTLIHPSPIIPPDSAPAPGGASGTVPGVPGERGVEAGGSIGEAITGDAPKQDGQQSRS
ncbi:MULTISPECIES: hypothetical protein [Streptomyces]|uniref:hypothetical protein n=1 Tax=Streptomyces TaxID=1883 RepID=UPI0017DF142A|nr:MULTISPECIES: hypothetical protein [Streptomyces]MBB4162169.1 hypothetical protein [Streptomyces cinereoruber]